MSENRCIFIGAAWPYANGDLHLGHIAGCLLPADIFARYCRLRGYDVLFVSGSDMHGTPITVTADKERISPEEVAMRSHRSIERTISQLDITYDLYTMTHSEHHFKVVQEIFKTLLSKGWIDKRVEQAPFCPTCSKFMPDRYIEGTCPHCGSKDARGDQCDGCGTVLDPKELIMPRCKLCSDTPIFKDTEHFYLLLSKMEPSIRAFVEENKHRWRPNTRNNTENFLSKGLKDRAITRDLKWGVPIPLYGYGDKCIYVWFEAVCGYLSASIEHSISKGDPNGYERFWKMEKCRHYYFLAKDNIPFHTIIWPAILLGVGGLDLPYDVPSNEYLQWDGSQFSKSRGHGVTVNDFLEEYDVDPLRFYLSTNMPERSDSNFDLDEFIQKNNTELLGAVGNYLHRVTSFIHSNYGCVPPLSAPSPEDKRILNIARERYVEALDSMEEVRLKDGIRSMMALVNEANRYFNDMAPWKLIKTDKGRCGTVMATALCVGRTISFGLYPYIPHSMKAWCRMIGIKEPSGSLWSEGLEPIPAGLEIVKPSPLFKRIEKRTVEESMDEKEEERMEQETKHVSFEDFMKMELRVGFVREISEHPNADKLYVLKVDIGEGSPRQIVAGLKEHYEAKDILGKWIIIVSNLKPAMMRGIESNGMLLAAEGDGTVSLLTVDRDVRPGSRIH
ncbi:MAG: methionine--tRNA ligase [Candidatus Thermoplasmatota archaeon]|nr:methionine--tRNA ligase [Candidatus Thermoplasmatota archaeon]